jgi:hypothetical protein
MIDLNPTATFSELINSNAESAARRRAGQLASRIISGTEGSPKPLAVGEGGRSARQPAKAGPYNLTTVSLF